MKLDAAMTLTALAIVAGACSATDPTILATRSGDAASDGGSSLVSDNVAMQTVDAGTTPASADWEDVGKPCTPSDEDNPDFSGYAASQVSLETQAAQCSTGMCMVNHYQGRVSCPEGQTVGGGGCMTPGRIGDSAHVSVPVPPACRNRPAADAAYCTCRCDGPPSDVPFCRCGEGFSCTPLLKPLFPASGLELAGSYCIRSGTEFDGTTFQCAM